MRIFAVITEMRRVMNVKLLARMWQVTCPEGHATSATWNMLCAVDRLKARGSSQQRCEQVLAAFEKNAKVASTLAFLQQAEV